ncbi:phage tail sheath C-terminal domain-containing protein [Stigmatella sp. ncwal1]|uniref:Phage tail sheath C-terminal domain-containing protein n=1 Tax=Stigmatella ashevillensis TaxID=2995309 RepID=A0ABT5DI20_9BACT|nr:phage tail sheath C-terminal domain-containing protein [Stigmatella ashevillena]MDC0713310.1 phage tail sheath C-terminal domain-containing protein [Stigmatella ashevillena]
MALSLQTPGVYNVEQDAFTNSVVPVETAIPAFVGYTARADYQQKSVLNEPVIINSMHDFHTYFGKLDPATPGSGPQPSPPYAQYSPIYHLTKSTGAGDIVLGGTAYDIEPDAATIYYLYNSIRLFFLNGGGTAVVVSVGTFGKPNGKAKGAADPLVNPNVKLADLKRGLDAVQGEPLPTMLVVPDGSLLTAADNATLMQSMLNQCGAVSSRVALLDVQSGLQPDPLKWNAQITDFRTAVGVNSLSYGAAYYPFLETTLSSPSDIDYDNCGGAAELAKILPDAGTDPVQTILNTIIKPPASNAPTADMSNAALLAASPSYNAVLTAVLGFINTVPPSGAVAGIYTRVDHAQGVWRAPANVSLTAVTDATFRVTDPIQAQLNVDALTGKSINAIRTFSGQGVLVWGARTLAGNSQDWRYLNVRRTLIMIEQSVKLAARAYVFSPNDASTWTTVKSTITNFLLGLWGQGALVGAKAPDAFSVNVGLGVTMSAQDILDGRMNIAVKVAIVRPAEFIVITYTQQQQQQG